MVHYTQWQEQVQPHFKWKEYFKQQSQALLLKASKLIEECYTKQILKQLPFLHIISSTIEKYKKYWSRFSKKLPGNFKDVTWRQEHSVISHKYKEMVNAKLHMMKAWVLISQFSGNVVCYNITGKKLMPKKNLSHKKTLYLTLMMPSTVVFKKHYSLFSTTNLFRTTTKWVKFNYSVKQST